MLNKVMLIGYVGQDPEITIVNNNKVAKFSIATTEKGYTTASGNKIPDRTEWHTIIAWYGIANIIELYVKKGSKIYVEGKLRHRTYTVQNQTKYATEINVESIELLDNASNK